MHEVIEEMNDSIDEIIDRYLILKEVGTTERPKYKLSLYSVIGEYEACVIDEATSLEYKHKMLKSLFGDMIEDCIKSVTQKKNEFGLVVEYQSNDDDLDPMSSAEAKYVLDVLDDEGFDYGLRYYSSFDRIRDPSFHNLRVAYIEAAKIILLNDN